MLADIASLSPCNPLILIADTCAKKIVVWNALKLHLHELIQSVVAWMRDAFESLDVRLVEYALRINRDKLMRETGNLWHISAPVGILEGALLGFLRILQE